MKKRSLLILAVLLSSLVALGAIYIHTSALAILLGFIAFCSVLWAIGWLYFERLRDDNVGTDPGVWRKYSRVTYSIFSISLLTLVYLTSVYTAKLYIRPGGKQPYFLNTDYHFLYNEGVSFNKSLTLYTPSKHYSTPGLFQSEMGTLTAKPANDSTILNGKDFLTPVFAKMVVKDKDSIYTPVNIPYDANIAEGFTITDGTTSLSLVIQEVDSSASGKKPRTIVSGTFSSSDSDIQQAFGVDLPYKSQFTVYHKKRLKIGYALADLLLQTEHWKGEPAETRQIIADWLRSIGNCYLLVRHQLSGNKSEKKDIVFFPGKEYVDHKYSLQTLDGKTVPRNLTMNVPIPNKVSIYCGFSEQRHSFRFLPDTVNGRTYMQFTYPRYLPMRAKGPDPVAPGAQYVRSLFNHYTGFINSAPTEGYLFHENIRNAAGNTIDGYMVITPAHPGNPIQYTVSDNSAHNTYHNESSFKLSSDLPDISWHYSIRDFSAGHMKYSTVFWMLTILYLLSGALLIFFPAPSLSRIEPVIHFVLYGLIFTRILMLWRIATFPPATDGEPKDIANYTNYEFIKGVSFTMICLFVFFTAIIIHRLYESASKRKNENNPAPKDSKLKWLWSSKTRILCTHMGVLTICVLIAKIVAQRDQVDYLSRAVSILIPVCSYFLAAWQLHALTAKWAPFKGKGKSIWVLRAKELLLYAYDSKESVLSLVTLGSIMVMDRGFGVLFLLFLLFKTVAVSFGRRPYTDKDADILPLLYRGHNYWIYGIFALITYIVFLVKRNLFHELLLQYHWLAIAILILTALVIWVVLENSKKIRRIAVSVIAIIVIGICSPMWSIFDGYIKEEVKHVKHRASLIYMPIDSIISHSTHNSFEEKKILETAESQWFINSYLNKKYTPSQRINFRPYFDRGVNYITQTRDVVLTRFVIAELGDGVMMMLLLLLALPLIAWFIFYRLFDRDRKKNILKYPQLTPKGYTSMMAVVLLFTLGLFVWLTATNRFVFFGQDFPFLALASRMSVMLPLVLLGFVLCGRPRASVFDGSRLGMKGILLGVFFLIIIFSIAVTGRSTQLNEENFTIKMKQTDSVINNTVNSLLSNIQDTMHTPRNARLSIYEAINHLKNSREFRDLADTFSPYTNNYTKSILHFLVTVPKKAFLPESPVFLLYDKDANKYSVTYNRNLFLELPAYEDGKQWAGSIYEWAGAQNNSYGSVLLNGVSKSPHTGLPYIANGGTIGVALLPGSWIPERNKTLALISVFNDKDGQRTLLQLCAPQKGISTMQDVSGLARELQPGMIGYVIKNGVTSVVRYNSVSGMAFAKNYYINGKQRMIYPLAENCFWASQYARAISTCYATDTLIDRDVSITLDYRLTDTVQEMINKSMEKLMSTDYKQTLKPLTKGRRFAVIAADGDGNVKLMADFAQSRKILDPNDRDAVHKMERDNFFTREVLKDREQWGNMNLIHMGRGPGSSIKPIIAAAVASQVNAGWQHMIIESAGRTIKPNGDHGKLVEYAGKDLQNDPWIASESAELATGGFRQYIYRSVNLYHSLFLFLGSYPRSSFIPATGGKPTLTQLLTPNNENGKNISPTLNFQGERLYLPSYTSGKWPHTNTDDNKSSYFGNTNSVLAHGLAGNFKLDVNDKNKNDGSYYSRALVNIGDAAVYDTLSRKPSSGFLWSYPEHSDFMQINREYAESAKNFKFGLLIPTRGGSPFNITPFMMAQMYGAMATFNSMYKLRLSPDMPTDSIPFKADDSWDAAGAEYRTFLKEYVLKGMEEVLTNKDYGTGHSFFNNSAQKKYDNDKTLYMYAKTGTIGNEKVKGPQSRRLALILSSQDLTGPNANEARIYTIYFALDKIDQHQGDLYRSIINALINSESFINYMKK